MSSLRLDTLRLCWLEAFIAVADQENISAAAAVLGVSQPTISRYIQDLEAWLGKKLIEVGGIRDPENPRVSIALTDDGREFYDLADSTISMLTGFRTIEARANEQISAMKVIVGTMRADLDSTSPTKAAAKRREMVKFFEQIIATLDHRVPLVSMMTVHHRMRSDFNLYEVERKREMRLKPKPKPSRTNIASLKL